MNELIWVGNTLYPRWFVLGAFIAAFLVPFILTLVIQWLRGKFTH